MRPELTVSGGATLEGSAVPACPGGKFSELGFGIAIGVGIGIDRSCKACDTDGDPEPDADPEASTDGPALRANPEPRLRAVVITGCS